MDFPVFVAPRPEEVPLTGNKTRFGGLVLPALLLIAAYSHVLAKLVVDWWHLPDFAHGFLVPPFAAYVAWTKRDVIRNTPLAPATGGLVIMAIGLLLLVAGTVAAELLISRLSLLVVLAGFIAAFAGWKTLRVLRFPVLVLLLGIPIPALIYAQLTLPLQTLASEMASAMFPLFGVPVLREGNVVQLPTISLEVAEACSGIRSIVSLLAISTFYGYFFEDLPWKRVALVLSSIPIAIVVNAARILGTGLCVQYWDPEKAQGFFHEFSGWVMFIGSLGCLAVFHQLLRLLGSRRAWA